jgi:hypothetical protein
LNIDIEHIGEQSMSQILTRSVSIALALNIAFVLWAATLTPVAV